MNTNSAFQYNFLPHASFCDTNDERDKTSRYAKIINALNTHLNSLSNIHTNLTC